MRALFLFFVCIMAAGSVVGQAFTVTTDKQRITIGEHLKIYLEAEVNPGTQPAWALPDSLPHFEVLATSDRDTLQQGERYKLRQTLIVTSWDSGRWNLPSFGARSGKPVSIEVAFAPFDPKQEYHDIAEIVEVTSPKRSAWKWYLLLGALLIGFFLLLLPPRKKRPVEKVLISDPGIYRVSIRELEHLQQGIATTEPKKFYTDIVQVFRSYLYKRKGIYSDARTSTELVVLLHEQSLPSELRTQLAQTLSESDSVKFARYGSSPSEMDAAVQTLKRAIDALEKA